MAENIKSIKLGDIYFQTGYGTPTHLSDKGSMFIDIDTPLQYINNDGFSSWIGYNFSGGSGTTLTPDELAAIQNSNSPSASNVFVTNNDLAGFSADSKEVKVSSGDTTAGYLFQKLTGSTNVSLEVLNSGGNEIIKINSTDFNQSVLSATTVSDRLDNWSPSGWPNNGVVKVISLSANTTNKICIISGLSGGNANTIVSLKNNSTDNLIILENYQSSGSTSNNRFRFNGRGAYFLFPEELVTLSHDGNGWYQFSANPNNGHDIFDDFAGVQFAAGATAAYTEVGFGQATGTGALLRNEDDIAGAIGTVGFTVGTTTNGSATIKMNPRSGIGYVVGANASKILVVARLALFTEIPTIAQNYFVTVGLCSNNLATGLSVVGLLGWVANADSAFWQCRAANSSNTIISLTNSSLPLSFDPVVLGTWYPNNLGDTVFFYSGNGGKDYTVDSMFVRVSSNYGGSPVIGASKLTGTTSRSVGFDYMGITRKGGIV